MIRPSTKPTKNDGNISFHEIPSSVPLYYANMQKSALLFYTYADSKYHPFAALYPLFALTSNPDSIVEICLSSPAEFVREYSQLIEFYHKNYPGRVLYSYIIEHSGILPHSLRFIVQPQSYARYVYIGDVDTLLLESDILRNHLIKIKMNSLDFSNVVRPGTKRLTGLHFIAYDKMFPARIESDINISTANDEELLYMLMDAKGFKMPSCSLAARPVHGIHISFFSRPLLPTLTTQDRLADYPSWYGQSHDTRAFIEKYLAVRYTGAITDFMSNIRDDNVQLRQLVQIIDLYCLYCNSLPVEQ